MSDGMRGYETILQYEVGSAYITLGCLRTLSGPAFAADDVDVSSACSSNAFKEYVRGMVDPGEVGFTLLFTAGGYDDAYDLYDESIFGPEGTNWRIQFYDGSLVDFVGYIKSLSIDSDYLGEVTASGSIKVTGKPSWSPAST